MVQLLVDPRPRDWREVATFLAPVRRSDSIAFTPTAAQGMKQNRVGVEVGPRHQNSYRKIKVGQSCPGSSRPNERTALARPQVRARGFCSARFTERSAASERMICGSLVG
jgi:hypothetical protein